MFNRSRLRVVVALSFAISALGVVAAPAAAETVLVDCSTTKCGYYEVYDSGPPYGANCKYETGSYDLDFMSARPPSMHGYYSYKTKVQWRFKILRQPPSSMVSWTTIYTSSYQSALANDAIPAYAGNGFSRRTWNAPENPTGRFKMWIEMRWLRNGNVEGIARVEYDWYKQLWNGNSYTAQDYCYNNFV